MSDYQFKSHPEEEWVYDHDEPLTRYSLGIDGDNPLVSFGINPSTAVPGNLDPTVASVARFAEDKGYDGWLMFNIYPQRATNPDGLHKHLNLDIHRKNVDAIESLLKGRNLDIWCAWGTLIEKRNYLTRCMKDIYDILNQAHCSYFRRGRISKAGHPHHPLYLRKTEPLQKFDLHLYIEEVI